MSIEPRPSLYPIGSERTDKPLVIECDYKSNRQKLSFISARSCSYDELRAKIQESFKITARPFKVRWEDHDGEQNYILSERTLDDAIGYYHTTDGSSVTMFVQVSIDYDGSGHSGAPRGEGDPAEGYQVSLAREEYLSSRHDGSDAVTSTKDVGLSRSHVDTDEGATGRSILDGSMIIHGSGSYDPSTGTESAHRDDPPAAVSEHGDHNAAFSRERSLLQSAMGQAWLRGQIPHPMMDALDSLSISDSFSLNTDSPMSDGLPDTNILRERYERRESYAGSRSESSGYEYEARVNESQSSIMHEFLGPQEVTCCSECSCILDKIKYTCATCGEKTPTSRAALVAAAAAAVEGKGRSRESSTSPTRTILGGRSPDSSGSTARVGYELCDTCFEQVGVYHSSPAASSTSPCSRTLPPTPNELIKARRSAPKQKGQLRHAFLEQFWDRYGWQVVEQDEMSRQCSGCESELSGNRYKCGICEKYTICRACYSDVHYIHPRHAFLDMKAKPTFRARSRSEISDDITSDDDVDELSLRHPGYHCSYCRQDIIGARFHCVDCTTMNVNICSSCEIAGLPGNLDASDGGHSTSHNMLKIPVPINEIQDDVSQHAHAHKRHRDAHLSPSVSPLSANTVSYDNGVGIDAEEDCIHSQSCNSCEELIIGVRYQCLNCPSKPTSFNLCSDCEVKSYMVHDPMHTFLKIPRWVDIPGPLESEFPIIPILYRYPAGPVPGSPSAAEISGDPAAYLHNLIHGHALCDRHVGRIVGKWYRCAFCAKDLCADCEALDTHDSTHAFLVFKAHVKSRDLVGLGNGAGGPPVLHGNIYYPQHE